LSIIFNGEPTNPSIGCALTNSEPIKTNTPQSHHQTETPYLILSHRQLTTFTRIAISIADLDYTDFVNTYASLIPKPKPKQPKKNKSSGLVFTDYYILTDKQYTCLFCGDTFNFHDSQTHYLKHVSIELGGQVRGIESEFAEGILPEKKSKFFNNGISEEYHIENEGLNYKGWTLPGQSSPYKDCGTLRFRGCLNTEEHHGSIENSDRKGKVYVVGYYRSCNKKTCSVCYESWAGLLASKITYRLLCYCVGDEQAIELYSLPVSGSESQNIRTMYIERAFKSAENKVIHVIVSVPKSYYDKGLKYLRHRCYGLLKRAGVYGGSVIYHPFRYNKVENNWFYSPHFHILGFGWVRGTKGIYDKTGWIIKNIGVRKSVFNTAMYQLSHAGVHKDYNVSVWYGQLAYNNFSVPDMPETINVCPLCGVELVELWYVGNGKDPPFIEAGEYFGLVEDWSK